MSKPGKVAQVRFLILVVAGMMGFHAIAGLINGLYYGVARWCSGPRNATHCRMIWASENYAYVQQMIDIDWFTLAVSVVVICAVFQHTRKEGDE